MINDIPVFVVEHVPHRILKGENIVLEFRYHFRGFTCRFDFLEKNQVFLFRGIFFVLFLYTEKNFAILNLLVIGSIWYGQQGVRIPRLRHLAPKDSDSQQKTANK